ncbi:MAG: universal stress protein [Meiothermus sp.]|uniref:universal stress protein n=1 Tax=Meiothermus sp. TaxID=1955249 RepID=UPI0026134D2B|nr:universal stress protein [Meiothermus sp.]MCS7058593.1 universal stress protein [Meiothermus sp.]
MFRRILVAVDESTCSERAGRFALDLAKAIGAGVFFVHVYRFEEGLDPARRLLEPWAAMGQKMGVQHAAEPVKAEDTAEGIVRMAQKSGCDLIAMGTHGREGLQRMLLGSVAERVSRLAQVPVLLVRDGEGLGLPERILAPVDGSQVGRPAFELADELARALGAELLVLHVVPPLPTPVGEPWAARGLPVFSWEEVRRALEAEGQAILEAAKEQAQAPRVQTLLRKARGQRASEVIVEVAREEGVGLIVMGTHGRSGLERLLLGSVAEGVAHHAPVPLLLVRSGLGGRGGSG